MRSPNMSHVSSCPMVLLQMALYSFGSRLLVDMNRPCVSSYQLTTRNKQTKIEMRKSKTKMQTSLAAIHTYRAELIDKFFERISDRAQFPAEQWNRSGFCIGHLLWLWKLVSSISTNHRSNQVPCPLDRAHTMPISLQSLFVDHLHLIESNGTKRKIKCDFHSIGHVVERSCNETTLTDNNFFGLSGTQ